MAANIQIDYRNPSNLVQNGLVYDEIQGDPLILHPSWVLSAGFSNSQGSVRTKLVDKDGNVFKLLLGNRVMSTQLRIIANTENKVVSVFRPNGATVNIDSDLFNGGKIVYEVSGQTQGGIFRMFATPLGLNNRYFGIFSGQGTGTIEFDLQVT